MIEHPYSLAWACVAVGHLSLRQGAMPQAIRVLERGLALSEAVHLPYMMHHCYAHLGVAYALSGRVPEALSLLERVREQSGAVRFPINYLHQAVRVGEGYVLAGHLEEAQPLVQWVLETARDHKQKIYQAYALLLLGKIAAQSEPPDLEPAATHYRQAITLAEESGMRPLQAHCYHGLGSLYFTLGRGEQARIALSTAIDLYRAMDMTFWLPQAEAALAQVSALA
jgi:tetratricopeptide (TPR) repeat protein